MELHFAREGFRTVDEVMQARLGHADLREMGISDPVTRNTIVAAMFQANAFLASADIGDGASPTGYSSAPCGTNLDPPQRHGGRARALARRTRGGALHGRLPEGGLRLSAGGLREGGVGAGRETVTTHPPENCAQLKSCEDRQSDWCRHQVVETEISEADLKEIGLDTMKLRKAVMQSLDALRVDACAQ